MIPRSVFPPATPNCVCETGQLLITPQQTGYRRDWSLCITASCVCTALGTNTRDRGEKGGRKGPDISDKYEVRRRSVCVVRWGRLPPCGPCFSRTTAEFDYDGDWCISCMICVLCMPVCRARNAVSSRPHFFSRAHAHVLALTHAGRALDRLRGRSEDCCCWDWF